MSQRHVLIAVGAGAFLLFLIALLPARAALAWLAPDATTATGVTGTLWRGSAAALSVDGLRLGATQWSVSPLSVLRGRLSGDVETTLGEAQARGTLQARLGGGVICSDCSYEGPASGLDGLLPVARALGGRVQLTIETLEIDDGWPVRAVATARLSRVPLMTPGAPGPAAPLGEFEATLSADPVPESGELVILVKDAGGPLQLAGELRVTPPNAYEFSGRAKARANAPPGFGDLLAVLGPRASDGSTEVSASGSF